MNDKKVWQYLGISFLMNVGLSIFGPIYIIFVLKYIDPALILIPNLVFHTTKTLAEYPTGFLADKYGKKWSSLIGLLGLSLSFLLYGFGTSLISFVLAEFVGALAFSFISGALDQWLQEKTNPAITTKTQTISNIIDKLGSILAVALLGLLYIPNLSIYWFLSSFLMFMAFLMALNLEKDQTQWHHGSTLNAVKSHWNEFRTNAKLVRMVSYESVRYCFEGAGIFMFWSLLLTQFKGLSIAEMFYVSAFIQFGLMVGNVLALRAGLTKSISYTHLLAAKGLVLVLMLLLPSWYAVGAFVTYEIMESIMRVKFNDYLNHTVIDSENASSIRSMTFFVTGLGKAVGMATMGIVVANFKIDGLWLIVAVVLIILALSRLNISKYLSKTKSI